MYGEIEWGETVEGGNRSSNAKYLNDTMQKYKEQTFGTNILDNPIPDTDKKISTTYPSGDYKPQNIYDNPITEFDKNYILTTPIQEGVAGNRLEYPDQTQDWRDYVYESTEKPTSRTFGQPIEMPYNGQKVKLRVDAEPDGKKIQIQAGHGQNSIIDRRIDINEPIELQIPKRIKRNLSKGQYQRLIRNIEKAREWLTN